MTVSHEVREIAEETARATVKEFFLALGVNADDPDAVIAVQKDFAHLRAWREASDNYRHRRARADLAGGQPALSRARAGLGPSAPARDRLAAQSSRRRAAACDPGNGNSRRYHGRRRSSRFAGSISRPGSLHDDKRFADDVADVAMGWRMT
jgi:hypothetical protein